MKTSSKKWHYRFIEFYEAQSKTIQDQRFERKWMWGKESVDTSLLKNYLPKDFCEYWRRFLVPTCAILMSVLFLIFSMMMVVKWTIAGILSFLIAMFLLGVFITSVVLICLLPGIIRNNKSIRDIDLTNNIFVVKVVSMKHKFCPIMEYEDVE